MNLPDIKGFRPRETGLWVRTRESRRRRRKQGRYLNIVLVRLTAGRASQALYDDCLLSQSSYQSAAKYREMISTKNFRLISFLYFYQTL